MHKKMKYLLPIVIVFLFATSVHAELKGLRSQYSVDGKDVTEYSYLVWTNDRVSIGIIYNVIKIEGDGWRIRRGRFLLEDVDQNTERVTIDWANKSKEVVIVLDDVWKTTKHTHAQVFVGLRRKTKHVVLPSEVETMILNYHKQVLTPAQIQEQKEQIDRIWESHDEAARMLKEILDAAG